MFEIEVSSEMQRREERSRTSDRMIIECRSDFVFEWTLRVTTSPLSTIPGSSEERQGYKEVHWKERGLAADRVKLVVFHHECFEFGTEWDIFCVKVAIGRFRCFTDDLPKRSGSQWMPRREKHDINTMHCNGEVAGIFHSQITLLTLLTC